MLFQAVRWAATRCLSKMDPKFADNANGRTLETQGGKLQGYSAVALMTSQLSKTEATCTASTCTDGSWHSAARTKQWFLNL